MATVERKVQFFRVDMKYLEQGSKKYIVVDNQETYASKLFPFINSLVFDESATNTRYLSFTDGNVASMYLDDINQDYIEGRMIICRKKFLPEVEQRGQLTALPIPLTAGLAEITHFVYYFKTGVMGIEFNFYGPRSSSIGNYIERKSDDIVSKFTLTPITRPEIDRALIESNEISMFQLEAYRNAGEVVKELNRNLGDAFNAATSASEAETIEIVLRKRRHSKDGFFQMLNIDYLMNLFKEGHSKELFNKLKMTVIDKDHSNKLTPVDLLADKLAVTKSVEYNDERSRVIKSPCMYKAIKDAYNELEDQLVVR